METPDVEEPDFGDAEQKEGEGSEAEAAFTHDQRKEEREDSFEAPGNGDAAEGNFVEDKQGDEKEWEEEIDLFGTAGEIEQREFRGAAGGRVFPGRSKPRAQRKCKGLRDE